MLKNTQISNEMLINPPVLKNIQDDLIRNHSDLIVQGLLNQEAREKLKPIVAKEHGHIVNSDQGLIDYIVQETVGTGVIEEIVKDENVTDIGFNGTNLIIETYEDKYEYQGKTEITEDYIIRIVRKFANAVGKDFSPKEPILDAVFSNIRINAVHGKNSPYGTTMSMRITRPKLALNKDNFKSFAPEFMYDLFEKAVQIRSNIALAGETGTGKTETQKLLISFVKDEEKIIMIEDVLEAHVKEMFPQKDIYSWLITGDVTATDLLKAAFRNNPNWIMITEIRGEESYEMLQAVLSSHNIITSLHAINARAIPKRFKDMAKIGYNVSDDNFIEDIRSYFDLGVHLKKKKYRGKTIRYLAEVVGFDPTGDVTIFEQRFIDGIFHVKTGQLPFELKMRMEENGVFLDFPENQDFVRDFSI
jgi:pilus assembly protein CpaF